MLEGKTIGTYSVIRKIGQGGMGSVYQAWDKKRKRFVGIKLLKERVRSIHHDLFEREIEILATLDHPNIVPIYDMGFYMGSAYFVMGYLEGASLFEIIVLHQKRKTGFALPFFHVVMKDIIHALHHAHSKGAFHRDLKPENILVSPNKRAFLLDFGLGKLLHDRQIVPENCIMGTPQYMAPEQMLAENLDHRTDIYSLGMIMYVALAGQLPFTTSNPLEGARRRLDGNIPHPMKRNRAIPKKVNDIIMKCLEVNMDDRYQLVADVGLDLDRALVKKTSTKSIEVGFIQQAGERLSARSQVKSEGIPFPKKPALINDKLPRITSVLKQSCLGYAKRAAGLADTHYEDITSTSTSSEYHTIFGTLINRSDEVRFSRFTVNQRFCLTLCFKVKILRGRLHLLVAFSNIESGEVALTYEQDFSPWASGESLPWDEVFDGIVNRFLGWTQSA